MLGVLCCVCRVLGQLASGHRRACSVCCVRCVVSLATLLLLTGVHAWCAVLRARCPGPLGSFSPFRKLCVLCCVCSVLGLFAAIHRCACSLFCVACAVSWANWLLFTGKHAWCVVLCVQYPRPLGGCSRLCMPGAVCARCPWPRGSCSPVCTLGVLCCAGDALGLWAPVSQRECVACSVYGAPCYVVLFLWSARAMCCVPGAACFVCVVLSSLQVVCVLVMWCAWCLGVLAACITPSSLHFTPRPRVGAIGVLVLSSCVPLVAAMVSSPAGALDALTLDVCCLVLFLWDPLYFATPKSRGVFLMHSWRMLFIHWVMDSLYLARPKSRLVVLMHS